MSALHPGFRIGFRSSHGILPRMWFCRRFHTWRVVIPSAYTAHLQTVWLIGALLLGSCEKTNLLKELYTTFVNYQKNVPLSKWLVLFLSVSLSMMKLNNIPMVPFWNDFSKETHLINIWPILNFLKLRNFCHA